MTHDELMVGLDLVEYTETEAYKRAGFYYDRDDVDALTAALRAVVELHKPFNVGDEVLCESCCAHVYLTDWPCETIQAIEKELS